VLFDIRAQLERLRRGATGDYQELCNDRDPAADASGWIFVTI